ncbi:MAG: hypothetical protein KatS3mg105_0544 [Gemmatales bacterium]|nr:MAG: hypothetical protein KatS3mg105_0544 [Gemmatales bacterium]
MHAPETLWHIVFNMLFLFWFGPDMEEWYGSREFLLFYLTAAFLGGIGYVAWELVTGSYHAALGASGAVTAVMVLCALHYPHRKILLFFVFPMSIWVFVIFQVARDLFELLGAGPASGTAVACHLAGAAFGYLYYKRHWHLSGFLSSFKTLIRRAQRPKLRIYREDERVVPLRVGAAETIDEQLEAKLDAVLEKIANSGQESLTENERAILLRASELMRKKRT